ncbi:hypothetical protein RCL1_000809 [Eukaryota sp. TZLM3-RCL]
MDSSMYRENSFSTHEVSSTFNNPNCLKPETLLVPRACLLKGLHLILENTLEKSKSFDFDPDFSKVLQLSLHFGNISRHFRELVQIAMANVFAGRTITNKHFQSPIFKKFFSRGNVLVQKQVASSCYSLHEFNVAENTNIEFGYSNAWKLHFNEKSTSFSPILQELVTHNCLRHLIVYSVSLGDFFIFPAQLSGLHILKIIGHSSHRRTTGSFNVQELRNLTSFHCERIRFKITGLSHLPDLKSIVFISSIIEDGLHPLVKLQQANFISLQHDCLEFLFKNRDNYEHCELSLVGIDIPASLDWVKSIIIKTNKLDLTSNYDRCTLFAANDLPIPKQLLVHSSSEKQVTALEFTGHNPRDNINIYLNSESVVDFSFDSPVFLETLFFREVTSKEVCHLLSFFPFIKCLDLDKINFNFEKTLHPESLIKLREMTITKVVSFFSKLPCLFKLSTLNLWKVNDFSFDVLSSLFPNLESISLDDCVIQGSSHENFTVKFMKISSCDFGNKWDVISQFNNLKLLTLKCSKDQHSFNLQLPSSLMNLNCTGYYPSFCDFLNGVDPTCMVSVRLAVHIPRSRILQSFLLVEQSEIWLADYQSQRPETCFVRTIRSSSLSIYST